MKQDDWILVPLAPELLLVSLHQVDVSSMKSLIDTVANTRVALQLLDLVGYLLWRESVLVHAVVELNALEELQGLPSDKFLSLFDHSVNGGVVAMGRAEGTSGYLFLSEVEEAWLVDNSKDLVRESSALEGDSIGLLEARNLACVDRLVDGQAHQVSVIITVESQLVGVQHLADLALVHEVVNWVEPSLSNGIQHLGLADVHIQNLELL